MPAPGRPGFGAAVARQVAGLLRVTRGRAFVLFTSYATLREVQVRLEPDLPYPILVQGSAPRTVLLREFRATPHAVLLATSSFWQGVDVAGEALSCVVIDKIPFAPPGDPLTAARLERIAEDGGNPFADYQVPLAILTLLQGLGRLLRHRTDRGVLALLDPRLHTRGYGYRFLEALPPAPVTQRPGRSRPLLQRGRREGEVGAGATGAARRDGRYGERQVRAGHRGRTVATRATRAARAGGDSGAAH